MTSIADMPKAPFRTPLPHAVVSRLVRLGAAIRAARLRRRWPQAQLARRAGVALMTLRHAEEGRPGVTLATYVAILWAMNLDRLLEPLEDTTQDQEGLILEAARRGVRARTTTSDRDDVDF